MTSFDGLDLGEWAGQFAMTEFGRSPGALVVIGDFGIAGCIAERHGIPGLTASTAQAD